MLPRHVEETIGPSTGNESVAKRLLLLGMHQVLATLGVLLWAGLLTAIASEIPAIWGHVFHQSDTYRTLSASPFYPVQIIVGLLWGRLVWKQYQHRAMLWIWVFPLVSLVIAMLQDSTRMSTIYPGAIVPNYGIMLSTYFGNGCRLDNDCFKQTAFTLPFYAAVSYAVGAWLASRFSIRSRSLNNVASGTVIAIGIVIVVDTIHGFMPIYQVVLGRGRIWWWGLEHF
jgi:hypothetical protein